MVNWVVYWAFFPDEKDLWPVNFWRIGKGNRLADVTKGDRLWLITSGKLAAWALLDVIPHAAYLAEIMMVEQIVPDIVGRFHFRIDAKDDGYFAIDPPLLVDRYLRPFKADPERSIGTYYETPQKLEAHTRDALTKELKKNHPDRFQEIFSEQ